ncbi:P-loop NTPase [Shigella flexneri]
MQSWSPPRTSRTMDAKKGIVMFERVGVCGTGIVESMSVHLAVTVVTMNRFGTGGAEKLAEKYRAQLLGRCRYTFLT